MGAWIDIVKNNLWDFRPVVSPFMGAWIDIFLNPQFQPPLKVSPFMGAWIDIDEPDRHWLGTLSSPWRGCAWRELHYGFIVVAFMVMLATKNGLEPYCRKKVPSHYAC
ncbi:TPA: hypothetical protein TUV12_000881 [Streptococcus equi subsp. zooepidemicus]|nr:hypothetical protein [Streptococcus equi subsp. zooepidemicus]HEL2664849.1 hypothetical protein [Streptococcus equi subsp. zooepidemicus]